MTDAAKDPFTPTFVRLGRSVWFTLESSQRARGVADFEERLEAVGGQAQEVVSQMCMTWMQVGDWSNRRNWNKQEWIAFLRTRSHSCGAVFMTDDTPEDEKNLFLSLQTYSEYYANLPGSPEGAPEGDSIQAAGKRVDEQLVSFASRLGDPLATCNSCHKCALGHKMLRCGRCKQVVYCSQLCQKNDWTKRGHKPKCVPIAKLDPKTRDQLVRQRYNELRRQGKDSRDAMAVARSYFGLDETDDDDAGKQVAAMFGMPI